MSTTDHKRAFRAPTDNDGGFYVHPNSLDDITLGNGTPGLQRIVATNQASAIGPYILRGLNVIGTTSPQVQAGEAVFKSGGIVSVLTQSPTGSGDYIYLDNSGNVTWTNTVEKSDTKLLIDYRNGGLTWTCTKENAGKVTFGHKDIDVINGAIAVKHTAGAYDTTIDTTTGITTSAITATTGTIATLGSTTATITNLNATTLQGDIVGNAKNIATLGNVGAATMHCNTAASGTGDVTRWNELYLDSIVVNPVLTGTCSTADGDYITAWRYNTTAVNSWSTFSGMDSMNASATWVFKLPRGCPSQTVTLKSLYNPTGTDPITDLTTVKWLIRNCSTDYATSTGTSMPTTADLSLDDGGANKGNYIVIVAYTTSTTSQFAKSIEFRFSRLATS
jgi:hypothetical protein